MFRKDKLHTSFRGKQRILTPGIQSEVPPFFANYLWNYIDALSLETYSLAHLLHFQIEKADGLCYINFSQEAPHQKEQFSLRLFEDDLLPNEILVVNSRYEQKMILPEEYQM
ncbi:DUF960 family protein [Lactobacillus selangorensis]|uniref:DUF960 family protein n=1 Tax=Lactobacillus selangorensis TaxID=81857 RepID=UPI00070D72ED|nr:DUF960 family protein [Lactobacillus selangorensis]